MADIVNVEPGAEWYSSSSIAFQIDGEDLMHVTDIGPDGWGFVRLYESTAEDARILFEGRVHLTAHETDEDNEDEEN